MSKHSTPEAARLIGVSVSTLKRWRNRGILLPQKQDRCDCWIYTSEDIAKGIALGQTISQLQREEKIIPSTKLKRKRACVK